MEVRTEVLTSTKQSPCEKASGRMASVREIDKRRRSSEAKLARCDAKVAATNAEIDRLRKLGAKGARE